MNVEDQSLKSFICHLQVVSHGTIAYMSLIDRRSNNKWTFKLNRGWIFSQKFGFGRKSGGSLVWGNSNFAVTPSQSITFLTKNSPSEIQLFYFSLWQLYFILKCQKIVRFFFFYDQNILDWQIFEHFLVSEKP